MGIIENTSLTTFQWVAKTGSVHAAAKELKLTQTAVTKRVQALEESLSLTLFLRSRRGMRLTDDGVALLQHCRSIEELEGALLSRISGKQREDVQLTLVGPTSAISSRVANDCKPVYLKHPYLRLHLRSDDHSNLIDLIRRGGADLVIVPPEEVPNEMDSKILAPDRYLLVGCPRWRGRKLTDIISTERIIDFYESDETTKKYLKKFKFWSHARKDRIYMNENQALIQLLALGVGFGTLTESVAGPYLKSGELIALNKGQVMEDPLALVWYPRTQKPSYFDEVVKSVK